MSEEITPTPENVEKQDGLEIEPLSDESLEDVAGGWCSVGNCSGVS